MTVRRYEVTGKINTPVEALTDAAVGDFITAYFDEKMEEKLIGAGAIRPAPTKPQDSKSSTKSSGKEQS